MRAELGTGWPAGFATDPGDRRAAMVLASLPGVTPRRLLEVARREGTARACVARVLAGELGKAPDRALAARLAGSEIEAALAAVGGRMILTGDEEYPHGLTDLADPPLALYARGHSLTSLEPRVAVVGARACTALGDEVAAEIGRGVAAAGGCIVSGGARGIDSASHRGALDAGGATIAVLGSGIDVAYPARSARLFERIAEAGAIVTEYPPGVPAQAFRFPARNRIVVALSEAVVVVEGATGSGSLISADHALDLGREVFAVPGPVTSPMSEVPLALIREGAVMIRGSKDLLDDLGWRRRTGRSDGGDGSHGADTAGPGPVQGPTLPVREAAVFAAVAGPTLPEQVAAALGWRVEQVLPVLLELEVRGLVRAVGGRYERRVR